MKWKTVWILYIHPSEWILKPFKACDRDKWHFFCFSIERVTRR